MTYDEAITRAESIVKEMETASALSVSDYKTKAAEVQELLKVCRDQLKTIQEELKIEK